MNMSTPRRHSRDHPSPRGSAGFTLLEMLLAMTLVATLAVLVHQGLQLGARAWDRGEARVAELQNFRQLHDFLRRQLVQSAWVYENDPASGVPRIAFTGDQHEIRWVSPMVAHLDRGGLYRVRLEYRGGTDAGELWWHWSPYRPGQPVNANAEQSHRLAAGISAWQVEYLGRESENEQPTWRADWNAPQYRPMLVRIRLAMDGELLPPIVAAAGQ